MYPKMIWEQLNCMNYLLLGSYLLFWSDFETDRDVLVKFWSRQIRAGSITTTKHFYGDAVLNINLPNLCIL